MSATPDPVPLALEPSLEGVVRLGLVRAEPVRVGPSGAPLIAELEGLATRLEAEHRGRKPAEIPGLAAARRLYRAFGIDPTRTRPSSEALLRRAVRGKPLPRVSNAVDLCNLLALEFLLPIGLYDAGALRGAVTLRPGREGESYRGIRKDDVHVGGRPVLVDDAGPFGNPTSDSLRTSVRDGTRSLWMVIFGPGDLPGTAMQAHVRRARQGMEGHLGAGELVPGTWGGVV